MIVKLFCCWHDKNPPRHETTEPAPTLEPQPWLRPPVSMKAHEHRVRQASRHPESGFPPPRPSQNTDAFTEAYPRYCWPVSGPDRIRLARSRCSPRRTPPSTPAIIAGT